jgi:hypothetical protein
MVVHGCPWLSVVVHGCLWLSMVVCDCPLSIICRPSSVVVHHLWLSIVCGYPSPIGLSSVVVCCPLSMVVRRPSTIVGGCPSSVVAHWSLSSVVVCCLWLSVICGCPSPVGLLSMVICHLSFVVICHLWSSVIYQPSTIVISSVSHRSLSAFISHHHEDHLALSMPLDL